MSKNNWKKEKKHYYQFINRFVVLLSFFVPKSSFSKSWCQLYHPIPFNAIHCQPFVSNPIQSNLILSYPILFYPILSYPILSYPILSYPILSYPSYPILSHSIPSHPISLLSYFVVSRPYLSFSVDLFIPLFSCLIASCSHPNFSIKRQSIPREGFERKYIHIKISFRLPWHSLIFTTLREECTRKEWSRFVLISNFSITQFGLFHEIIY